MSKKFVEKSQMKKVRPDWFAGCEVVWWFRKQIQWSGWKIWEGGGRFLVFSGDGWVTFMGSSFAKKPGPGNQKNTNSWKKRGWEIWPQNWGRAYCRYEGWELHFTQGLVLKIVIPWPSFQPGRPQFWGRVLSPGTPENGVSTLKPWTQKFRNSEAEKTAPPDLKIRGCWGAISRHQGRVLRLAFSWSRLKNRHKTQGKRKNTEPTKKKLDEAQRENKNAIQKPIQYLKGNENIFLARTDRWKETNMTYVKYI